METRNNKGIQEYFIRKAGILFIYMEKVGAFQPGMTTYMKMNRLY